MYHRLKLTSVRARSLGWLSVLPADRFYITHLAALGAAYGHLRLELGAALVTSILHVPIALESCTPPFNVY